MKMKDCRLARISLKTNTCASYLGSTKRLGGIHEWMKVPRCPNVVLPRRAKRNALKNDPHWKASQRDEVDVGNASIDLGGTVVIVGGGIAGLASAVALKNKGIPVIVLERSESIRDGGNAIALWKNAWCALDDLGVAEGLRKEHSILDRVELCAARGDVLKAFSFDEVEGGPHEFRGVWRGELIQSLLNKLEADEVQYGVAPTEIISNEDQSVQVMLTDGRVLNCMAVVGCDGVGSKIAKELNLPKPNFAGYSGFRGVAEFSEGIPFDSNVVRQIFGQGIRAGMYPLTSKHIYWFVAYNSDSNGSTDALLGSDPKQAASSLVASWEHNIQDVISSTPMESITLSPIKERWSFPFQDIGKGPITLAGDALHPMTPNLGQGGCCALEDAVLLARYMSLHRTQMQEGLRMYEKARLKRCTPLTVRASVMGTLLQIDNPLFCFVRDRIVENLFDPSHFLDHTFYDCTTE